MHKQLSIILLGIQILSLLYIAISAPLIPSEPALLFSQILALGFILWGAFTLHTQSRFSLFPEVLENAKLVTDGPFQYIRHPMYSGVLLYALVAIINYTTFFRLVALLILTLDVLYKLHVEEEYLEHRFGGHYKLYKEKTKRIIPFLF